MNNKESVYAVILNVPRIAPLRPSMGTAIIKSILNDHNKSSKLFDINLDFFNTFSQTYGAECFVEIDYWFYIGDYQIPSDAASVLDSYVNNWCTKILEYKPEIVMISVFTWQCQQFTKLLCQAIRKHSDVKILIGGQGMIKSENTSYNQLPVFAHELHDQQLIDYWIQGEAEISLPDFLKNGKDSTCINTNDYSARAPMTENILMDFSDHNITQYQNGYTSGELPLESSRGCVRSCSFCDWPVYADGFRAKPGAKLANELISYYNQHGVKNFYFNDALINGSVKDQKIFCKELISYYQAQSLPQRYFRYSGLFIVRPSTSFKESDFELMGQSGADTVVIGIETGSDRVRHDMNKQFTNADLDFTMEQCMKNSIRVYFLMIVGYPTETERDFQDTLDMLTRYRKYVVSGTIVGVNFGTTFTIGEGTPIWHNYKQLNLVGVNGHRPEDIYWMSLDNPALTYKERCVRRLRVQKHAVDLGYNFWKGDDQINFMLQKYQQELDTWNSK